MKVKTKAEIVASNLPEVVKRNREKWFKWVETE